MFLITSVSISYTLASCATSPSIYELAETSYYNHLLKEKIAENPEAVHSATREGFTPLHYAAQSGSTENVMTLVSAGANINAKTKTGVTPLFLSAERNKTATVQLLTEAGAELDAQNNEGQTALHVAALNGSIEVTRILVKNGATTTIRDNAGRSPLDIASQCSLKRGMTIQQASKCVGYNIPHPTDEEVLRFGEIEVHGCPKGLGLVFSKEYDSYTYEGDESGHCSLIGWPSRFGSRDGDRDGVFMILESVRD